MSREGLTGKTIVITAGPTREPIDPVRYISNRSSGKMGFSLAEAALAGGAEVTLISGPTSLAPPPGAELVLIETTAQLHQAVLDAIGAADCLIMAAAPADYRPVDPASAKIKKDAAPLTLSLQPTVDILKDVIARKKRPLLTVGFALETDQPLANARKKLKEKKLDMIVVNQVGEDTGFDSDTNQVTVLRRECDPIVLPLAKKSQIAARILDMIAALL
ncbi:MAG: hypothetical protein OEV49_08610 [candidate division Zixibacteria bacterium]|nr:hypothetical protein [candidate division Zixibacteria bacterium]MDH3936871.1 hypothetical protein [candidate division Zixibacteria bacterium]MDH4033608.1 hypothetical protein [candidate division Zixibacteria bacterium]